MKFKSKVIADTLLIVNGGPVRVYIFRIFRWKMYGQNETSPLAFYYCGLYCRRACARHSQTRSRVSIDCIAGHFPRTLSLSDLYSRGPERRGSFCRARVCFPAWRVRRDGRLSGPPPPTYNGSSTGHAAKQSVSGNARVYMVSGRSRISSPRRRCRLVVS